LQVACFRPHRDGPERSGLVNGATVTRTLTMRVTVAPLTGSLRLKPATCGLIESAEPAFASAESIRDVCIHTRLGKIEADTDERAANLGLHRVTCACRSSGSRDKDADASQRSLRRAACGTGGH